MKGLSFKLLALTILLYHCNLHSQRVYDIVVAKDGTGDYIYINSAIAKYSNSKKKIFIKNGVYKEKIVVDIAKKNLHLIGESVDGVIITYDDYSGKKAGMTTAGSYTALIEADGFYSENITFQNTATQAQAVAIYTKSDTIAFKNCRFDGFQDTHYADNGRQYFLNCETKGDVDFIFGSAAVFYDQSIIISSNRKGGYITAPSESVVKSTIPGGGTFYHGILFKNCIIKAEEGLANNTCYLGRPWGPFSSSVFVNCELGNHIKPEGWSTWSNDNHNSAFFAEYNSKNTDGNLINSANRVDWSKQLVTDDTSRYTLSYYLKGWNPLVKTTALNSPENVKISEGSLVWDMVSNAKGYIIVRNDSVIDFTVNTIYPLNGNTNNTYKIKSVNQHGAMGESSDIATGIRKVANETVEIKLIDHTLLTPEFKSIEIFNITGTLVKTGVSANQLSVSSLEKGIYFARILTRDNKTLVHKFYKD